MERIRVSAAVKLGKVMMPIETPNGVKTERECKTVTVRGRVYQMEFVEGELLGTDLKTLEVVLLDME